MNSLTTKVIFYKHERGKIRHCASLSVEITLFCKILDAKVGGATVWTLQVSGHADFEAYSY